MTLHKKAKSLFLIRLPVVIGFKLVILNILNKTIDHENI